MIKFWVFSLIVCNVMLCCCLYFVYLIIFVKLALRHDLVLVKCFRLFTLINVLNILLYYC